MTSTRRAAQREATREALLDSARALFAERGVMGSSVEEISERAGYTRGAFYANFRDRAAIVEELVRHQQGAILARISEALASEPAPGSDAMSGLTALLDRVLDAMPQDRESRLVQAELEAYAIRNPEAAGSFRQLGDQFQRQIAGLIEREARRLGRELVLPSEAVAGAALAVVVWSGRDALLKGGVRPEVSVRELLAALFLGLSQPTERPADQ
jgi:AcrR family transcriptional regulator